MGSVPYSGRLSFAIIDRQRDFILLGNQNGREIEEALRSGKTPDYSLQQTAQKARRR
jgi:hypothetical protein